MIAAEGRHREALRSVTAVAAASKEQLHQLQEKVAAINSVLHGMPLCHRMGMRRSWKLLAGSSPCRRVWCSSFAKRVHYPSFAV